MPSGSGLAAAHRRLARASIFIMAAPVGGCSPSTSRLVTMLGSVYDKSARIYDLLYTGTGIKDYAAEAAELHRIIDEACPSARTLLDVACGTGAHLAHLREWYAVEGVDSSPAMLAV